MEDGQIALLVVVVLATLAFPVWFFASARATGARVANDREQLLAAYRPTQTLAESALLLSAPVELRTQAARGALRVWLDCKARPTRSWSASGTLSVRGVPEGAGYREDHASVAMPFTVGEDSEGMLSSASPPAGASGLRGPTGVLGMENGSGGVMMQLGEITGFAPGSELFVRVVIDQLSGADGATFRAFIGVSSV